KGIRLLTESSTPGSMRPRTSASRERTQSFHAAASLKSLPLRPASANSLIVSAASSKRRKRTLGSVAEKTAWRKKKERTKHANAARFRLTPDVTFDMTPDVTFDRIRRPLASLRAS